MKPLYEYLPTIWIAIGLGAALFIDNPLGQRSGAVLVIIGTLIFNMRINHRS